MYTSFADISNCYTTSYVANVGAAGTYLGSGTNVAFSGKNYYLTNLSPKVENAFEDVTGVSGKDAGRPDFIFVDAAASKRRSAYIYDDTLKFDYGGRYYFPTVEQLGGEVYEGITDIHYGDWQVPYLDALGFRFVNADTLYIEADPVKLADKSTTKLMLSLTGETSTTDTVDNSIVYLLDVQDLDDPNPVILKQGKIIKEYDSGTGKMLSVVKWGATVTNPLPIKYDSDSERVIITLDDITTEHGHFADLFDGTSLIPGENIEARLAAGEISWSEMLELEDGNGYAMQNSLFALGNKGLDPRLSSGIGDHTACIGYIRHLQNLDPAISGLDNVFDRAYLINNLDWNEKADVYAIIYNVDSTQSVTGSFYGIYNPNLKIFDGRNLQLANFVIGAAPNAISSVGAGNAGLFRYVANVPFTVSNLDLCGTSAIGTNYAGALIAQSESAQLTVDTVLARHRAGVNPTAVSVIGVNAGGLVGTVRYGSAVFRNSAASLLVNGSENAGGLVGGIEGLTAAFEACLSGGHTESGSFATGAGASFNITSNGSVGSLIGSVKNGGAAISRSFGSASVKGANYGGGIVGYVNSAGITFDHVYSIAPVDGVSAAGTPDGRHGAIAGAVINGSIATGDTTYFLPELYTGNSNQTDMGMVVTIGAGSYTGTDPEYAYYQKNESSNKISAKYYSTTMQIKTIPYDTSLGNNIFGSTREYPFSIWTSFPFTEGYPAGVTAGYTFGTYYGDWQPIDTDQTVERTVRFAYTDPISGECVDLSAKKLGEQTLLQNEKNQLLSPTTPYYPGWEMRWTIDGLTEGVDYYMENGLFVITPSAASGDLVVKGVYDKQDDTVCSVTFFYNKDAMNGETYESDGETLTVVYTQIGASKMIPYGTSWGAFMHPTDEHGDELPTPLKARTINGYRFVGWCRDKAGDDMWADDEPIEKDEIVYAKYEKLEFFTVTIDFLYEIQQEGGESTTQAVTSIPRYSLDDVPQYRIVRPKGEVYNGKITVPSVSQFDEDTTIRMILATEEDKAHAWCVDGEGEKSYDLVVDPLTKEAVIYAEQEAHFQVIYQIPAEKSPRDIGMYRFVYVYKNTDPASAARAFSATGVRREYHFGSDVFFPMDMEGDNDPIIPNVAFET